MKPYLLLGSVLGSILLAASCMSPTDDGGPPAPDEPVAAAAAAVDEAAEAPVVRENGLPMGMMPWRGGPQIAVTPTCKSPKLAYFGGPIIQAPQVVTVFWSSYVNSALTAPTTGMAQFFTDVLASTSYMGWLQEYDTVGVTGGTEQAMLPGAMIAGRHPEALDLCNRLEVHRLRRRHPDRADQPDRRRRRCPRPPSTAPATRRRSTW